MVSQKVLRCAEIEDKQIAARDLAANPARITDAYLHSHSHPDEDLRKSTYLGVLPV